MTHIFYFILLKNNLRAQVETEGWEICFQSQARENHVNKNQGITMQILRRLSKCRKKNISKTMEKNWNLAWQCENLTKIPYRNLIHIGFIPHCFCRLLVRGVYYFAVFYGNQCTRYFLNIMASFAQTRQLGPKTTWHLLNVVQSTFTLTTQGLMKVI